MRNYRKNAILMLNSKMPVKTTFSIVFSNLLEHLLPFLLIIKFSSANYFSLEDSKICHLRGLTPYEEKKTRTVTKVLHTPTQRLVREQVSRHRKISWKCLNWVKFEVTGFDT